MARVAPVQTSEVRSNPQPNQQQKSGDPFAMLLDTVSKGRVSSAEPRRKPEAPESARVSAADKPERPQPKQEAKQAPEKIKDDGKVAKDACEPKEKKVSDDTDEDAGGKPGDQKDAADTNVPAAPADTPVVTAEAEVSINLNLGNTAEQAVASEDGATPVADASSADTEIDPAAQAQQNTQQVAPQAAAVPAVKADAAVDAQTGTPVAAAAVQAAASTEVKQDTQKTASAETEIASVTDAVAKTDDASAKKEEPVQTQKPVASNHAEAREAAIAEKGEQQTQAKPAHPQQPNEQAKEHASTKPLEQVPVQSAVENSAPRQQQVTAPTVQVMPEPVRALAGSINPVNLRAANEGVANAVQANAGTLGVEIASRAKDGTKRFDIRLDPPELGRVEVRLETGTDGKTSTRLIVERPETLDLLQRDARNLERALQSAGLQTDDSGLQFSLQDQSQQQLADANSDRGYERRGDFFATEIEDAEPASPVMDRYAQAIIARGGVDIRI